mmetsp:Transcript_81170/g.173709  ORF Transcript_81170/g.173709 Transcript_81170/m.173709 type:complete len:417 (+) Transcript_81170:1198-2448(+)
MCSSKAFKASICRPSHSSRLNFPLRSRLPEPRDELLPDEAREEPREVAGPLRPRQFRRDRRSSPSPAAASGLPSGLRRSLGASMLSLASASLTVEASKSSTAKEGAGGGRAFRRGVELILAQLLPGPPRGPGARFRDETEDCREPAREREDCLDWFLGEVLPPRALSTGEEPGAGVDAGTAGMAGGLRRPRRPGRGTICTALAYWRSFQAWQSCIKAGNSSLVRRPSESPSTRAMRLGMEVVRGRIRWPLSTSSTCKLGNMSLKAAVLRSSASRYPLLPLSSKENLRRQSSKNHDSSKAFRSSALMLPINRSMSHFCKKPCLSPTILLPPSPPCPLVHAGRHPPASPSRRMLRPRTPHRSSRAASSRPDPTSPTPEMLVLEVLWSIPDPRPLLRLSSGNVKGIGGNIGVSALPPGE